MVKKHDLCCLIVLFYPIIRGDILLFIVLTSGVLLWISNEMRGENKC